MSLSAAVLFVPFVILFVANLVALLLLVRRKRRKVASALALVLLLVVGFCVWEKNFVMIGGSALSWIVLPLIIVFVFLVVNFVVLLSLLRQKKSESNEPQQTQKTKQTQKPKQIQDPKEKKSFVDFIEPIRKDKVKLAIVLAAAVLVVFNLYFYFTETYVSVTDNYLRTNNYSKGEGEEVISIKYSDILAKDESFSDQISMYIIEQPADEDSLLAEKAGALLLLAGSIATGIAVWMFLKNGNAVFVVIGAVASAIGSVILNGVYTSVKDAIDDSLLGTVGTFFGDPVTFHGTSSRLMIVNLILGGIICIASYFYIHRPQAQINTQPQAAAQPQVEIQPQVEAQPQAEVQPEVEAEPQLQPEEPKAPQKSASVNAMPEVQKKTLQDVKDKTEKMKQLLPKVGAALVVILVLCLLVLPFATGVSFGDLSDLSNKEQKEYSIDTLNTFRVLLWVATVGTGALIFKAYQEREKGGMPYKYYLISGGAVFFLVLMVMIFHLTAETDIFYGKSTMSLWWFLPLAADIIYLGLAGAIIAFEKVIVQAETNIAAMTEKEPEKEEAETK